MKHHCYHIRAQTNFSSHPVQPPSKYTRSGKIWPQREYSHHQCTRIPIVPLWKGRKAASLKRISCRTKQTNFSITMAPSVHRLNYGPSEIWLEWPSVGLLRGVLESGHSLDRTALLCVALRCCISSTVSSTMSSSMPSLS